MGLQVITKSTDVDLTTTGQLKLQLGRNATASSTSDDARLSSIIRRISKLAETYVHYPLTVQRYRETVPAYGRRSLMLSRTPVRAVLAVYDATDTGTATRLGTSEFIVEDADAGLIARDRGFEWTATLQGRAGVATYGGDAVPLDPMPVPGQEYKPWLVDYVAGYTYDGVTTGSALWSTEAGTTSTERTLPEDIEAAILLRCQQNFEGFDQAGPVSETLGDMKVVYKMRGNVRSGSDDGEEWQQMLAPYQRLK